MDGAGPSSAPGAMTEKAVVGRWQALRQEVSSMYGQIAELEMELTEHRLVIGTIEKVDPGRRCFRMVGGVLVERTVGEVLPAVRRNRQGLEELIQKLASGLAAKKSELEALEKKYNIRIRNMDEATREQQQGGSTGTKGGASGAGQGVLVGPS